MTKIQLTVDGASVSDDVEPRMLLVQYLREKLGKTGTVIGCDTSNCGACTVHLDGTSVKSCNVLAVQANGRTVTTIEGLADAAEGELHPVQASFRECHGLQCGFCTPGMIMQAVDFLAENPNPTRGGGAARHGGQPLPLHRLPQHRQERPPRRRLDRGGEGMTATQDRPAVNGDRPGPAPQGGPAADHRAHPVDRQHHPAGHAPPRDGPQPLRPRDHHLHRHRGRQGLARTWSPC